MNIDEKTYKEFDAVYRYRKSILLDSFIEILIFAPIMVLFVNYFRNGNDYAIALFYLFAILFFTTYFLSDKVFKVASIGKKIYKIKLTSKSNNAGVSIKSIIYRRFLEVWIHPMFTKMNFLEKSKYIDKKTGTKIIKNN